MYTKTGRATVSTSAAASSRARKRTLLVMGAIALVILEVALLVWLKTLTDSQLEKPELSISGRIEIEQFRVASIAPGRIETVLIKEGDTVKKEQELVKLDDSALSAGAVEAERALVEARRLLVYAKSQKAKLGQKMLETSQAQVASEETTVAKPAGFGKKAFSLVTAPARLLMKPITAPAKKAEKVEKSIKQQIARAQHDSQQMALAQVNSQIMLAQASVEKAQSAKRQLSIKKGQYKIVSPIDGVVANVLVHGGDVVPAGKPLMLINDPASVYVRGFIPESQIGLVKVGQSATVLIDEGNSKKRLSAHISSIDAKPSFTPENIYFKDDRVKQVFGMKLRIDNPDGTAKPGMSCEAELEAEEPSEK